jgi:hypothetical protein
MPVRVMTSEERRELFRGGALISFEPMPRTPAPAAPPANGSPIEEEPKVDPPPADQSADRAEPGGPEARMGAREEPRHGVRGSRYRDRDSLRPVGPTAFLVRGSRHPRCHPDAPRVGPGADTRRAMPACSEP